MAKSKRNSDHVVSDIADDTFPDAGAASERPAASKPEPLTIEQLRALFDSYDAANAELEQVKTTIEAAAAKRSDAVRAIVEAVGNKGPWTVGGVRVSVTERGGKFHMTREGDSKLTL